MPSYRLLKFFEYKHLPENLQEISKNLETSKPFTDEELRSIGERIQKGSLVIMKRPPWSCVCGNEIRDLKYIGDTSGLAEWEFTCDKCGEVFCS